MKTLLPCLLAGVLLLSVAPASASTVNSGSLNAPGERSHNVGGGWPELFYMWEGVVRDKSALGPRVDVRMWPLAISAGLQMRFSLLEQGRVSLALLVNPSFNFAGWGGSRAEYPLNYGYGRSRAFRASVGPGVNAGLLATIDINVKWHILATFENPLVLWVWTNPTAWFLEWPLLFSVGAQFDATFRTSLFARVGGGPAISFAGANQLLGGHWHLHVGVQVRY